MVVDPDLLDSGGLLDSLAALGGKRIADMNVTELETVWNAVRAIEATLTSYDRTLANQKYARTSEWADSLMMGSMSRKRRNRKISLDMADPYTFFSAYGDGGMQVYRTLRNAQDREHVMLTELRDAAKRSWMRTCTKPLRTAHVHHKPGRGADADQRADHEPVQPGKAR